MTPLVTLQPADRLLVINLAGVGDVVLCTPALRALRMRYPTQHIALLVAEHAAHLLDSSPDIDAQWALTSTRAGWRWWRHLGDDAAVLRQLRAQHFALAINVYWMYSWQGSLRLAYYLRRIGPRASLGYDTDGKGWCFTQRIPQSAREAEQQHEADNVLTLVRHMGCPAVPLTPHLAITPAEQAQVRHRLNAWGLAPHVPLIMLSPGAYRTDKRWPAAHFVALGQWLQARYQARVLLLGDAHECSLTEPMARALGPTTVNATGQTSLRELLALLMHARLVVTNDTGTMHLAAALQRPLVALFGPTNLARFRPLGDPACQRVLQAPSRRIEDMPLTAVQRAIEELWAAHGIGGTSA